MSRRILVLGATGILGRPVARSLVSKGHRVRMLVRSVAKARRMFGTTVEMVEGSALDRGIMHTAMAGCDAVHISLSQASEIAATKHVVGAAQKEGLERITYVSATTACEENRWFEVIDIKMRAEAIIRESGLPHVIFRPTWVMETLPNFVHGGRMVVIVGRNPPELHFFAAADFGRVVAVSYEDDRTLGMRLFIHGPEGITLPDALARFAATCRPDVKLMYMKLWQARLFARLTRRARMAYVTRLIDYFDKVGELGDPTEANALLGAPGITLDDWFAMPKESGKGIPH